MTLPAGQISLSEVNVELNLSPTATISLNDAAVRALAGVPSGQIAMSNLQGKSNDPYFFASLTPSTYGYQIAIDSSSNIYQTNNIGPGSGKTHTIKISNTGVIQWQYQVDSTSVNYPSVNAVGGAVDSSGNVYSAGVGAETTANNIYIFKYNTSGTLQWQKRIGDGSSSTNIGGNGAGAVAVDSSGNPYFVVGNIGNVVGAMKMSSAGASVWQSQMDVGPGNNSQAEVITVDSSGNVYIAGYLYDSGFSLIVGKFDSSGSAQWARRVVGSGFYGAWGKGVGTDSSGNVYVASQNGSSATYVLKYNSSGTNQWARDFGTGGGANVVPGSMAVDSSGNSYTFGGSGSYYFIVKYNSSGTIQWQRTITNSANYYMVGISIALNAAGTIMYLNGYVNTSPNPSLFAKLPTDGSKTGTFTVSGLTYTYAVSSLADAAASATFSTPNFNGGGFSRTVFTSSLTNAAATKTIAVTNV